MKINAEVQKISFILILTSFMFFNFNFTFGQCDIEKLNTSSGGQLISNSVEKVESIYGPNNNGDKGAGIRISYFRLIKVNNPDRQYFLLQIITQYLGMYRNSVLPRKITLYFTNGQSLQLEAYQMENMQNRSTQFNFLVEDEAIRKISNFGIKSIEYFDHKLGNKRSFNWEYAFYLKDQYDCIKKNDLSNNSIYEKKDGNVKEINLFVEYSSDYFTKDYNLYLKSIKYLVESMAFEDILTIELQEPLFMDEIFLGENVDGGGLIKLGGQLTNLLMIKIGNTRDASILIETSEGEFAIKNIVGNSVIFTPLKEFVVLKHIAILHNDTKKVWENSYDCRVGKRVL